MTKLARLAALALLTVCASTPQAEPVIGKGTWETTLKARALDGNSVALNSASAAFFYDTTLNVTWLANMNQNGTMTWSNAMAWADGLATGGFTDWRLPTVIDSGNPGCNLSYDGGTDCGYNVQTQVGGAYSEWAHLYYVTLGNLGNCAPGGGTPYTCEVQVGAGLTNTANFQNMQSFYYWSGTEYVPDPSVAWVFRTINGLQTGTSKSFPDSFATAVRTGDVLRVDSTVAEPNGLALAGTALAGLGVVLRRRRATRER